MGWATIIIGVVLVLLVVFIASDIQTQEKWIEKSPDFLKDILEPLTKLNFWREDTGTRTIDGVEYVAVGRPPCEVDDSCDVIPECDHNCICQGSICYKQVPVYE